MKKTFVVRTYGCQMNVHESDKIRAALSAAGFVERNDGAQVTVFNTCCIRNTAEDKIINHIADMAKTKKPGDVVVVVGCLSQAEGRAKDLRQKYPHIDIILGTHNVESVANVVQEFLEVGKPIVRILDEREHEDEVRGFVGEKFINITYGCENYCSYCIVPYVRGKLVCRDVGVIEDEFKRLVEHTTEGVIYLLGQNVNSYKCPRTGVMFPELLERVCGLLKNGVLVNFMSSHPKDFSAELVDVIAKYPTVERNIHLPMQSGCDKTLAAMNRGYSVAEYMDKVRYLRERVPDVKITTDIICGFPGESEEDFAKTVETVKRVGFNAAFIFPYSRRSGTVADKMDGQVDHKTKKRRATELIAIQREISKNL